MTASHRIFGRPLSPALHPDSRLWSCEDTEVVPGKLSPSSLSSDIALVHSSFYCRGTEWAVTNGKIEYVLWSRQCLSSTQILGRQQGQPNIPFVAVKEMPYHSGYIR